MLSLGIKEAVVNNFSDYNVTFDAAAAGDPSAALWMNIEGFGKFTKANITQVSVSRKVDWVKEVSKAYFTDTGLVGGTAITPALNDIYVVQYFVRTTRYQSEFANDFIKQGRPIVLEILGDGTSTLAQLVDAAITARNARFAIGEATPFSVTVTDTNKSITATVSHQSLHIEKVLFRLKADFLDTSLPVDVTAEGTEGQGNGSQVEESVRMGFGENVNPYGIKAGTNVDVAGAYSELFWKVDIAVNEKVGYVLDSKNDRSVSFDVFANENGNLGSGGGIELITEFLLHSPGATIAAQSVAQTNTYDSAGDNIIDASVTPDAASVAALFIA